MTSPVLADFIKAYDVRGLVPEQLSPLVARTLGYTFAEVVAIPEGASRIVVGHDMRPSSPELAEAFASGAAAMGVDVLIIGLCSTDGLYFASGSLNCPGAMLTASHNPAQYNGIKMCRALARPVGQDTGLATIRDRAQALLDAGGDLPSATPAGTITHRDLTADYARHLQGLVDLSDVRPLKVVVDAGNGMAGHTVPAVLTMPQLDVIPLFFELDGTFPNHEANPLEPENLRDLQKAVVEHGADLGLAFDGDADRCFIVDERGLPVSPSAITALVAAREIARDVAAGVSADSVSVVYNVISSRAVEEVVRAAGARPVRARVGHSFIKDDMAHANAVFGGEHSAHYYFREFWFADTGMLAALHVLSALGESSGPLSALVREYDRYPASGEINSRVASTADALSRVREWASRCGASVDTLDGLTLTGPDEPWWWCNVRPSNTEPLLRLNVEARDVAVMERVRDDVLAVIRQEAP